MSQPFEKSSQNLPMKKILWNNFMGGIAWGFGATVGISIIFAILGLLAKNINFVPIVGTFTSQVIDFVLQNNRSVGM